MKRAKAVGIALKGLRRGSAGLVAGRSSGVVENRPGPVQEVGGQIVTGSGTLPARQPVAWCWCYCCSRRLELFAVKPGSYREEGPFSCCGRTWGRGEAQPRPRHEALEAEVETLRSLVDVTGIFLARWQGRRPHGLKALLAQIERARAGRRP